MGFIFIKPKIFFDITKNLAIDSLRPMPKWKKRKKRRRRRKGRRKNRSNRG
jgi:hypothetical protein